MRAAVVAEPHRVELRSVPVPAPGSDLPFPEASFDLVVSRHPVRVRWDEVARVLKPGGSYFSQDVGHPSVGELSQFMLGDAYPRQGPDDPSRDPRWSVRAAGQAALDVVDLRQFRGRMEFFDVGLDRARLHRGPVPGPAAGSARADRAARAVPGHLGALPDRGAQA